MRARDFVHKATLLLDRGRVEEGVAALEHAIQAAQDEGDFVSEGRAACCLGEIRFRAGNLAEAAVLFRWALGGDEDDDQLAFERERAAELLARCEQGG